MMRPKEITKRGCWLGVGKVMLMVERHTSPLEAY